MQVEGELPLLGKRRAAHLHRQAAVSCAAAVQAQIAAHVSKLGVVVDLLPFLSTVVLSAALQFDLQSSGAFHHRQTQVHMLY